MSRKKKIDRAVDDVECPVQCGCNAHATSDFFKNTLILDMEYLDKVPGVKNQSVFKEAYVRGYSIY